MHTQDFRDLIERYQAGQLTVDEMKTLRQLLEDPSFRSQLEMYMDEQLANRDVPQNEHRDVIDRIKTSMEEEWRPLEKPARTIWLRPVVRWSAAAVILGAITVAGLQLFTKKGDPAPEAVSASAPALVPIVPGKDGAILTLADGRTIVLDSAGNGLIASENGAKILLRNGQVVYETGKAVNPSYNVLSTPNGRQFQVVLPDGTKAWLNAASSLRYPTAFIEAERKVEITGEVYFEVAKNRRQPFKVKVAETMEVVVLGTHFNINAYPNEAAIQTTLLEGAVNVKNGTQQSLLKPGEQAWVNDAQNIRRVSGVDLKKVMAWKNGAFDFNGASLGEVMRQLERWYDIEVVYEKGIPDLEFMGTMGRHLDLETVLKGLRLSGVNFKVVGRKVVVLP